MKSNFGFTTKKMGFKRLFYAIRYIAPLMRVCITI